jgi:hypothetical protein
MQSSVMLMTTMIDADAGGNGRSEGRMKQRRIKQLDSRDQDGRCCAALGWAREREETKTTGDDGNVPGR